MQLTAKSGETSASSILKVVVETPPPARQLDAVYTKDFKINSPLWSARAKALMVNWIPHCIDQINRADLKQGEGGIDNFIEAAKALRGEPHGAHKGYVFSNAWVHQTVEAMSIALWKPDLLGGVVVIKGKFADGSPMTAIPNFARTNRDPASPAEQRGQRRPPTSIVWINEG